MTSRTKKAGKQIDPDFPAPHLRGEKALVPQMGAGPYTALLGIARITGRGQIASGTAIEAWYEEQTGERMLDGHIYQAAKILVAYRLVKKEKKPNPDGHNKPVYGYTLTRRGKMMLNFVRAMLAEEREAAEVE